MLRRQMAMGANKGVLLACGGFPGNPYMMEQLDPLGTSVTTACSYSPADKGYGIRAAVWAGANLDKEAAPMLFDRGVVAPGVDGGYVDSDSAFGGKAFPGTVGQYNPGSQPFLKVNRHGERFMNESQEYDNASHASFQQPRLPVAPYPGAGSANVGHGQQVQSREPSFIAHQPDKWRNHGRIGFDKWRQHHAPAVDDAAESVGAGQNESDDTAYAKQRGSGKPFAGESAKQQCNAANCENNQARTKILAGHDQAERAQIAENKLGVRAGRADLLHLLARVDQLVRHPDA